MSQTISHYRIVERLAAGGMGQVFKAEDLRLRRTVVLKFLSPLQPADSNSRLRLLEEAQSAAALSHPGIAAIYDVEQAGDAPFIVMEYVEGETLARRLAAGPLGIAAALSIAIEVADALKAAHARGLVHCDVKSSNIMISPPGRVKVLDFGLARLTCPAEDSVRDPSSPKEIAGTAAYMSPEQIRGWQPDERTDVFSLGVVLYEMIAGRRPFEGESRASLIESTLCYEPLPLGSFRSDVPLDLQSIVSRTLAKDRSERYASAAPVLQDLQNLKSRLEASSAAPPPVSAGPLPGSGGAAFRGLLPFHEADRERFYGRDIEAAALFSLVSHHDFRFGVLFGDSGCGKTSLLLAGLVPRLWEEGFVPIYCRPLKDPLAAVIEECRTRSRLEREGVESPVDYLQRISRELGARLVIICDQFDEFFGHFRTKEEREPFVSFISECHRVTDLPVRFLVSIRSDYLYLIATEFADRIAEPLMSSRLFHLQNLSETQAKEIIERSVNQARLPFEPGLGRRLALDLALEGKISPSELQIVGEQMQRRRIFTLRDYDRAGGRLSLSHSFLEDIIQASGDRQGARLLLRSLVSEDNTRLALPLEEILKRTQCGRERIERILRFLVQSRLVREIQEENPWCYELMHDYMIDQVNRITSDVLGATDRANRLLRQYLANFGVDRHARIPLMKLWFIRRHSDLQGGERQQELFRNSLRSGLLKSVVFVLLAAAVTAVAAAGLSISEQWDGIRLSDGHTAATRSAVFSPDGRLVVSGGEDGKAIVWDFQRRRRLATLEDQKGWITTIAFSPDGKWFATGSTDRTVMVWDARLFRRTAVLRGHQESLVAIGFSPDGRHLISSDSGDMPATHVWETESWKKIHDLPISVSYGNWASLTNGQSLLAAGYCTVWNLAAGRMTQELLGGACSGSWTAVSPDGSRLVTIDAGGIVSFWDLMQKKCLGRPRGHHDHGRAVAFSPDGRLVATGAEDIVLWDAATQTKLVRLEHTAIVWSLAFSPDGRWLISSHGDGSLLLWDVAERDRVASFNEHSGPVRAVAFSPDGTRVASGSEDRSVIIWNSGNGRKEAVLAGHNTRVTGVDFSADGRTIASCDQDGTLIDWDIASRQIRWSIREIPAGPLYSVRVSPSGSCIATSWAVYDSAQGRKIIEFSGGHIYGQAFSADGRWLACAATDGFVSLWDTQTWRLNDRLELPHTTLVTLAFSPDSRLLATGEDQGAVRLLEIRPLRQVAVLGRHNARIKSIAFSPDGKRVASASDDQTIALWDVAGGKLAGRVGSHTSPVLAIAFSPDGGRLLSGEHDKSVRLFARHRVLWGFRLD